MTCPPLLGSSHISTPSVLHTLTGDYTIDPADSQIGFSARHAMVTKVRGSFISEKVTLEFEVSAVRTLVAA